MAEPIVVTLERFAAQGRAVARREGKAILVERGIAGESVAVEVVRDEPRFAIGRVAQVLSPSPHRVQPACPHFAECGGCDWQHVAYLAQVNLKQEVAQDQLERIGGLTLPMEWSIAPADQPLEYRDKLEWVPVPTAQGWVPGLHGRDSDTPLPISRCWLAPEPFGRLAAEALRYLQGGDTLRAGEDRAPGNVTRLTVQGGFTVEGEPTLALTLHVRKEREVEALVSLGSPLVAHCKAAGLAVSGIAVAVGGDEDHPGSLRVIAGSGVLYKQVAGLRYPMPLNAFFQVHPAQALSLVQHVVRQLSAHLPKSAASRILDLFCGAGLFSIPLLAEGYRVAGAELSRPAVQTADRMAREGKHAAAAFRVVDLDRPHALRDLIRDVGHPDAVLVDPPRRGLAARLVTDLLAVAPKLLVYVSCDPATFARDAKRLAERYELVALRGFDMFPQTHHLEIVGTFLRR